VTGVAPCWKDVALSYKAAGDVAVPLLGMELQYVMSRYGGFVQAVTAADVSFARRNLYGLAQGLDRMRPERRRFENVLLAATTARSNCVDEPSLGETARCWQPVAKGFAEAVAEAEAGLGNPFKSIFPALERTLRAKSLEGFTGSAHTLRRALDRMYAYGKAFSEKQRAAERIFERCRTT
jgi:hypothetical protein